MRPVCIYFEQGVKMLTLSSMENLIVECNLQLRPFFKIESSLKGICFRIFFPL